MSCTAGQVEHMSNTCRVNHTGILRYSVSVLCMCMGAADTGNRYGTVRVPSHHMSQGLRVNILMKSDIFSMHTTVSVGSSP